MKTTVASIAIGILFIGTIGYTLLGGNIKKLISSESDVKQKVATISIPRNIQIPEGETMEFVLPVFWVEWSKTSSMTMDDVLEDINMGNEERLWHEEVYTNEDGSITLVLTQKQLEARISRVEERIDERVKNSSKMKIVIGKDLQSATYYIKAECTMLTWMMEVTAITPDLIQAQMLSGVSPQEWNIREILIGEKTGEIIGDMTFPEDKFKIKEDEWNQKIGMENTD